MDYYLLTDLAARVGYHLALSGAETFRVEETIRRIIGAYGIECETFSIPNCVMVSLEAANGKPLMVMKRVGFHGNDLESVEKLNALSRRICAETPDPSVAAQWLDETLKGRRHYSVPVYYLGNFCAAAGFCPVFGGTLRDSLFAGLLGLIIGFVSRQMDRRETNPFFSTIVEAFAMAVPAYLAAGFHLVDYIDFVIIGTLMILVPGLLITTSMRDIIYGDTNSGINRIVQVLLSAFAIALGTAAAWRVTSGVYGLTVASGSASYPAWAQAVMIFVACTGFFILFNVHDWGSILCALGGVFTWMTYLLCRDLGMSIYSMNFFAAVVSALYSELMDRLHRRGIKAADVARGVELIGVEILEKALVALALFLAVDRRELLPEGLLVRAAAVVFDHGRRARPNGVDEGFGLVAVGRELFGEELEVSGRERLLIHRQQRSIQVE